MPDDPASLERLHDVVLPAPVPWWPLAPGWYVIGSVLMLAVGLAAWRWWHHWRSQAYRRAALAELRDWESERSGGDPLAGDDLAQLAALLRRTAMAVLPRDQVAGLPEADWIKLLQRARPGSRPDSWDWLAAAYRPGASLPPPRSDELRAEVRSWILHHRLEPPQPSC